MPLERFLLKLEEKETLNIGFHNHCQTGRHFRKKPMNLRERIRNLFLEEGFANLTGLLDKAMASKLDGLYITDFGDEGRYKEWTSEEQLVLARQAGYEIEQGKYFTFFSKDGIVKFLARSHEVPTTQGHVLFAGLKKGKRFPLKKSLEATIREATDNELKIADHPYAMLKGQNGTMAYSKDRKKDASRFDAFEKNGNFYFPFSFANLRVVFGARKYKKPLLRNSDDHHPKDIDAAYNIFKSSNLAYSSERAFRDSIHKSVREKNFKYQFKPIPPWRIFHHIMMTGIGYLYRKLYGKHINA
jgi:hypothetical protein